MQFQTGIGTASELHRTTVLFGTGTAGTAGTTKTAGIGTTGIDGTAIEKSWNRPCLSQVRTQSVLQGTSHTGRGYSSQTHIPAVYTGQPVCETFDETRKAIVSIPAVSHTAQNDPYTNQGFCVSYNDWLVCNVQYILCHNIDQITVA